MEVPTTLVVTNDFPPRVGGIQRTLEALVRALPRDRVGVFCPTADGASEYDAEAPFAVFRQPERSLFPTRNVGRRVRAAARELGAEVVLFGATYPLALLGPALAEDRVSVHRRRARLRVLVVHRSRDARGDAHATSRASRVAAMCSAFIARTVRTAVPARRARLGALPGCRRRTVPAGPRDRRRSEARSASASDHSSCASAGSSLARVRTS